MADYDLMTGVKKAYEAYSPTNKPTAADVGAIANGAAYLKAETYSRSEADANLIGKAIGHPKTLGTEDLDTIKTAGVYSQNATANTSAERHYPENLAGTLIVTVAAGVQQTYHVYNSSRVWTRAQHSTEGWTGWARQYNTLNKPTAADIQNVVSPVSAGGIIERGSNANGEYVKFADGTLICTGLGIQGVFSSAETIYTNVTYAAEFAELNSITAQVGFTDLVYNLPFTFSGPTAYNVTSKTGNLVGAGLGIVSNRLFTQANADIARFGYTAIGRWK